jgi:Chromate transporter
VGLVELFFAFAKMSLAGFGGVLVFAWRGIVDQRRWMTAEEFNATFALCQFRRGPNTVNLSEGSARPITILAVFWRPFMTDVPDVAGGLLISAVIRMALH